MIDDQIRPSGHIMPRIWRPAPWSESGRRPRRTVIWSPWRRRCAHYANWGSIGKKAHRPPSQVRLCGPGHDRNPGPADL